MTASWPISLTTASSRRAVEMLRFSDDRMPGIRRCRRGRGWTYFDAEGNRITDREEIDRLNAVGLPPAYDRAHLPDSRRIAMAQVTLNSSGS